MLVVQITYFSPLDSTLEKNNSLTHLEWPFSWVKEVFEYWKFHMVHLRNPRNQREIRHEGINIRPGISGQDGGVGRHTVPPCTTKRKTTTNLKTKNNQNWQKIKLCGSLTTKELKKKHSFRRVGGAETGSQGEEDLQQGRAGGPGSPTFVCR